MKAKYTAIWLTLLTVVMPCQVGNTALGQPNEDWTGITFEELRELVRGLPKPEGQIQAIRVFPDTAPSGIVILSLVPRQGWQVIVFKRMPAKHFALAWNSEILNEKDGISSSSGKELTIARLGHEILIQLEGCVTHVCPDDFGILIYAPSQGKAFKAHYQSGQIHYSSGLESPENQPYRTFLEERVKQRVNIGATAQDRVWRYEPTKVELQGRLTIEQRCGPPGYGENPDTDQRVQIPVLLLSAPIDVQGDPQSDLNQETVRGVQRVQLVLEATSYRRLVGKNITVKGTLFRAITGHQYTDVVMNVLNVRESPSPKKKSSFQLRCSR